MVMVTIPPVDVVGNSLPVIETQPPEPGPGWAQPHLVLLTAIGVAIVAQGGYYPDDARLVGVVLAGAVALMLGRRRAGSWRRPTGVTVALCAMGLWAAVSGLMAHRLSAAVPAVALAGGAIAAATIVGRASLAARLQLVAGLTILGTVAAATGWLGVVLRMQPWAHPDGGLWRAATTVTYANAGAALLAAMALLALAQVTVRDAWPWRLGAYALLIGVGATLSRAGVGGVAVGLCILAPLLGARRVVRRSLRALVGAAIAVAGLVPSMPVGASPRPAWAILGLVLGGVLVGAPGRPHLRVRTRVVSTVGVSVVAGGLSIMVLSGMVHFDLRPLSRNRITLSSPDRRLETDAALAVIRRHPIVGTGPGAQLFIWTTPDHGVQVDRYAHDEYLQLAAEQGVVGVVLLGALVLVIARRARRRLRQSEAGTQARAARAGAVAALIAVAGQSAFDFVWHVPAVALLAAVLIGLTALSPTQPKEMT